MATTQRRIVQAVAAACVAAILAPALETRPVWGQSRAPNADERVPHREGNIYDHKSHQPTQAEVEAAGKAIGADPLPSSTARGDSDIETCARTSNGSSKPTRRPSMRVRTVDADVPTRVADPVGTPA
jgi:hypothetical protein